MSASARSWFATIAVQRTRTLQHLLKLTFAFCLTLMATTTVVHAIEPATLSDADRKYLTKVEDYLNELDTIQSRFVQANPDGGYSEGTMYLQRPGKLRFDYDPPDPYLIIASGKWFMYLDRELEQTTYLPLEKTPAYFILRPKFSFGDNLKITAMSRGENVIRIELVQASEPDAGQVMLIFTESPLELRKWRVIDAQGGLTDTTLINPSFGAPLSDQLFEYSEPTPTTGAD